MIKFLLTASLLLVPSLATLGVDISDLTTQFSCLVSKGYTFTIIRGYRSPGIVDSNIVANLKNAWAGGMTHVDVYLFPCVPCGNPANQATALVNAIKGQKYGMIWLDIETYAWTTSLTTNQNFILGLVNQLKSLGQTVGVYTNYYNWQSIVGVNWPGCASLPLWYAHYDNNPSFTDFTPFGGWTHPSIKQYSDSGNICSASFDLDYYP